MYMIIRSIQNAVIQLPDDLVSLGKNSSEDDLPITESQKYILATECKEYGMRSCYTIILRVYTW